MNIIPEHNSADGLAFYPGDRANGPHGYSINVAAKLSLLMHFGTILTKFSSIEQIAKSRLLYGSAKISKINID